MALLFKWLISHHIKYMNATICINNNGSIIDTQ
jgi:hypothetical protein